MIMDQILAAEGEVYALFLRATYHNLRNRETQKKLK